MSKEQIFSACRDIIGEWGLQHLLMDQVASRCGVSKKTIYELFGSKESLVQQLGASFVAQERASLAEQLAQRPLLAEKIRYLISYLIDLGELIPHEELIYLKKKFTRNYSMLQEFLSAILHQLQELLEQGQITGVVLPELQLELHMHLLRAQLLYLHRHHRQLHRLYPLQQWRAYLISTFLRSTLV